RRRFGGIGLGVGFVHGTAVEHRHVVGSGRRGACVPGQGFLGQGFLLGNERNRAGSQERQNQASRASGSRKREHGYTPDEEQGVTYYTHLQRWRSEERRVGKEWSVGGGEEE